MARKSHPQKPHAWKQMTWTRKGKTVTTEDGRGKTYDSISKAKRVMRTGSPDRSEGAK